MRVCDAGVSGGVYICGVCMYVHKISQITNVILVVSAEDVCIYRMFMRMCVFQCVSYY